MSGYKAFISYSHADTPVAAWLHRALESYRLPKRVRAGGSSPRIGAVFRDRSELSAGTDLSRSVRDALAVSEYLIVICSPAAAGSVWVGQEIDEFRRLHGDDRILCLICGGTPFAGAATEECFPAALGYRREGGQSEPVAADIRAGGDGRRLAKLKLVSGLLGVGLDELIQRDAQRRNARLASVAAVSLTGMVLMAVLSLVAVDARLAEEARRSEAEALIEFMLSDLRLRLEAVGRLDVLSAVGEKVIEYYANDDLGELEESSLGRRARAFHVLGEVYDLRGDRIAAREALDDAYQTTLEALRRDPDDGQRVYEHAQSVFWIGFQDWQVGDYSKARGWFEEYVSLARRLVQIDPERTDWLAELGSAQINLGIYELETGSTPEATDRFLNGLSVYQQVVDRAPANTEQQMTLAGAHAWLADAYVQSLRLEDALTQRREEERVYQRILDREPGNQDVRLSLLHAFEAEAAIQLDLGDASSALENLTAARRLIDALYALEPDSMLIRYQTAGVYASLADTRSSAGQQDGVDTLLNHATALASSLLEQDGEVLEWQTLWHTVQIARGRYLIRTGRASEALPLLEAAVDSLRTLAMHAPDAQKAQRLLAESCFYLALARRAGDPSTPADPLFQQVVSVLAPYGDRLSPRRLAILEEAHRQLGSSSAADAISARLAETRFRHPDFRTADVMP